MTSWFDQALPLLGFALFREATPPRPASFSYLERLNIELTSLAPGLGTDWTLRATHPSWGTAILRVDQQLTVPDKLALDWDSRLTPEERESIRNAHSAVAVRMHSNGQTLLRARKNFLRFLGAVTGNEGVAAMDAVAQQFWVPDALVDELSHDADVDIQALYTVHAVPDEHAPRAMPRTSWLHSHGLADVGGFDFDLLSPSSAVCADRGGILRAIALAIVEDRFDSESQSFPIWTQGSIRFVSVRGFMSRAPEQERQLRSPYEAAHDSQRFIACEPVGGLLDRALDRVRLARSLTQSFSNEPQVAFSSQAKELMAERARRTWELFRSLREEFRGLDSQTWVQLGMAGEARWFEVRQADPHHFQGRLLDLQGGVAQGQAGAMERHPVELLTDWAIHSPLGPVTPQCLWLAHQLREKRDELSANLVRARR